MTKTSFLALILSALFLVCPIAHAKKEKLPGVPLETYIVVDWNKLSLTQKKGIIDVVPSCDRHDSKKDPLFKENPCSASWTLYLVDLNGDGIKDLISTWCNGAHNYAGDNETSLNLGTKSGFSTEVITMWINNSFVCGVTLDDTIYGINLLKTKHNGMRDLLEIGWNIKNTDNLDKVVRKKVIKFYKDKEEYH